MFPSGATELSDWVFVDTLLDYENSWTFEEMKIDEKQTALENTDISNKEVV